MIRRLIRHLFRLGSFIFALAGLSLPVAAPAQQALQSQPGIERGETGRPLAPALWRARDGDTTIYLFGTVHLLKPGLNWLRGPVADALTRSDSLVTEILNDNDARKSQLQGQLLELALLPRGQSLRDMMPPESRKAFEALLLREGMRVDTFDRFEPWYPGVILSMQPLIQQGLSSDSGVEARLALAHGTRPREGLESARFQIELFHTLPRPAQLAYLASVVTHYDEVGPLMDRLVEAWGKGDTDAIGSAMLENADPSEVTDALIVQRNRAWANWIVQRLARPGTAFVAVGAGHLAGPDSIQHILAERGVQTERVQ